MARKTDKALRGRIAKLKKRGVQALHAEGQPTVADLLDVVGDLTLLDIHELVEVAAGDNIAALGAPASRRSRPRADIE